MHENEGISKQVKDFDRFNPETHHRLLLAELTDKMNGKSSQEHLLVMCYRWMVEYALTDMQFQPLPEPTALLREILGYTPTKRRKVLKEDSEIRQNLLIWRGRVLSVTYRNRDNQKWLRDMNNYFVGQQEYDKVNKIKEVMSTYETERHKV